jgi:arylsulfatase A-like enzyme
MKTILILMDSLNRHYLNAYGQSWVKTPNLDRLAARSTRFDNHWCGSMPCMPARREMMTGRYNFLETPWSSIQPWDMTLPALLRQQTGTFSHMITDHYHYFHSGGEAYHTLFNTWEFERGQEGDVWRPLVKTPAPQASRGKGVTRDAYWRNRAVQDSENDLDYPTPRCFQHAVDFLELNRDADNWHLHLEVFDPHEPFDCPQKYRDLYNDNWNRDFFTWPEYAALDPELDDDETIQHIRKSYAGTLTMADHWLGKLLDKLDETNAWEDTTVILTSDHGHLLGEHNYWAKNYMFDYARLAHIPLFIASPGQAAPRCVSALTSTIDLVPTLAELFGAEMPGKIHGKSLCHLLENDEPHHDAVLYGYFGKDVNVTDGTFTYCRQPLPDSTVHHHTGMPRAFTDFIPAEKLRQAEWGNFLKDAATPQLRFEVPCHHHADAPAHHRLYNLSEDPEQKTSLHGTDDEPRMVELLCRKLREADAPPCQFARLALD